MNPRFPIYIISKGRWKARSTSNTLEEMGVPYRIVVEPEEYEQYASVIDKRKILVLPDNFSKLGQGSIPVRNWVWEHSIKEGHAWHWIMDDNISSILRYNNNAKIKCVVGTPFYVIEEFVLRYENIAQAGMNYTVFCPSKDARPPITFNTRIYSCILIRNDVPLRWRGRYNEDTDLSLRMLKLGWVTCLFNAFVIEKRTTLTQRGGNTDTVYNTGDKRKAFAKSLKDQHVDVVKVIRRFDRFHHFVNYKPFASNLLVRKKDVVFPKGVDDYGMRLVETPKDEKDAD